MKKPREFAVAAEPMVDESKAYEKPAEKTVEGPMVTPEVTREVMSAPEPAPEKAPEPAAVPEVKVSVPSAGSRLSKQTQMEMKRGAELLKSRKL